MNAKHEEHIRIKDELGHFLGKVMRDGSLYIYCKRCKEFHYCGKLSQLDNQAQAISPDGVK